MLGALAEVPRHIFVDEALAHRAYEDIALPIGFGQTISNPWIVARMLELARAEAPLDKVLEIGTGCGYQAAVLSRLARQVYSVERISQLLMRARIATCASCASPMFASSMPTVISVSRKPRPSMQSSWRRLRPMCPKRC